MAKPEERGRKFFHPTTKERTAFLFPSARTFPELYQPASTPHFLRSFSYSSSTLCWIKSISLSVK